MDGAGKEGNDQVTDEPGYSVSENGVVKLIRSG